MSVHGIRANTNRMEFVKCRNVSEGYPYISSQLILERSQLRLLLLFSFYMGKVVLKNLSELYSVMTLDSKGATMWTHSYLMPVLALVKAVNMQSLQGLSISACVMGILYDKCGQVHSWHPLIHIFYSSSLELQQFFLFICRGVCVCGS